MQQMNMTEREVKTLNLQDPPLRALSRFLIAHVQLQVIGTLSSPRDQVETFMLQHLVQKVQYQYSRYRTVWSNNIFSLYRLIILVSDSAAVNISLC